MSDPKLVEDLTNTVMILKWGLGSMGAAFVGTTGALWRAYRTTQRRADSRAEKAHKDELDSLRERLTASTAHQRTCEERISKLEALIAVQTQERFEEYREQAKLVGEFTEALRSLAGELKGNADAVRAMHGDVGHLQKQAAELIGLGRRHG